MWCSALWLYKKLINNDTANINIYTCVRCISLLSPLLLCGQPNCAGKPLKNAGEIVVFSLLEGAACFISDVCVGNSRNSWVSGSVYLSSMDRAPGQRLCSCMLPRWAWWLLQVWMTVTREQPCNILRPRSLEKWENWEGSRFQVIIPCFEMEQSCCLSVTKQCVMLVRMMSGVQASRGRFKVSHRELRSRSEEVSGIEGNSAQRQCGQCAWLNLLQMSQVYLVKKIFSSGNK